RVTHGSHAKGYLHELAFYGGFLRKGCHVALPRTRQGFQFVERLLRVRLRKSHGRERHQNNGQHKTKGFHVSFSLRVHFFFCSQVRVICWRTSVASNHSDRPLRLIHDAWRRQSARLESSVIVNYNTISDASFFFDFSFRPPRSAGTKGSRDQLAPIDTISDNGIFHLCYIAGKA